jgi:hypothetical protein
MLLSKRLCAVLLVSLPIFGLNLGATPQSRQEFPDAGMFLKRVREAVRLDYELQSQFTYIERRRDVRVSKLGKVEIGPERMFEVFPSATPGRTYKRLIAVNGRQLTEAELAARDREHQKDLAELAARAQNETPVQRAERLKEEAETLAEREAILNDGFAAFEPTFIGRETYDGQKVLVISLTPRENARVNTREGRWMKKFEGRVWVAEQDHQIARLEMRARDDVSIGWGILGRVHEGSRFVFTRHKFEGAWLPAEVIFDATGRTLLFRKFDIDLTTTYSRYKRMF